MKIKKIAIIFILMITFSIIFGNKVEGTTGKINSETVRLRKNPDTKSTILDQLDQGDEVEILEQVNGWYKVKVETEQGKVTGYVSEKLVNVDKTEETIEVMETTEIETPTIIPTDTEIDENKESEEVENIDQVETIEENESYILEQELSIKILPLINSKEKAKISGNITIIETINNWSRIENDTEIGWVRTNILEQNLTKKEEPIKQENSVDEKVEPEQVVQPKEEEKVHEETKQENTSTSTEINKTGYVKAEGLRVRKGPSTDSKEITSLAMNDQVEIIGQEGNWYKININGEIGYISAKYISDTKLPETTSRSGNTLKEEKLTSEVSNSETKGETIVEYAKQYLGYKYVSGGTTPTTGFDCSGFTSYVYKNFGVSLNRTSGGQMSDGEAVEKNDLQLGDIVLFNNDANTKIGHVGIYVGSGNFIHASNPEDGIKITTLETGYYAKRYVGARRVI